MNEAVLETELYLTREDVFLQTGKEFLVNVFYLSPGGNSTIRRRKVGQPVE